MKNLKEICEFKFIILQISISFSIWAVSKWKLQISIANLNLQDQMWTILTGLFESKFLLGGGGVNLTPPSDLGPEGADRREILHGCEDTSKEYCYEKKIAENGLFIILL